MRIDWKSTGHWPSRLVRYVIALFLFGVGFWVSVASYDAGSGPFIWFLVTNALWLGGMLFVWSEFKALVARSATPKDRDDE